MTTRRCAGVIAGLSLLLTAAPAQASRSGYTTFAPGYDAFTTNAIAPGPSGGAYLGLALIDKQRKASMGVLRISASGQPVRAFGSRGLAHAPAGSGVFEDTTDLIRAADGGLVLTGTSELTPDGQEPGSSQNLGFGITRFSAAGKPAGGTVVTIQGGADARYILPRPGGGFLLGGAVGFGTLYACSVTVDAALVADLDRTSCEVPAHLGTAELVDGAVQEDGTVVAAMAATTPADSPLGSRDLFAITRRLTDGKTDPSFGTADGYTAVDFGVRKGSEARVAQALVARPGGGWIVAGTTPGGFGLAAFTADGKADSDFGSAGKVVTNVDGKAGVDRLFAITAVSGGYVAVGTEAKPGRRPHLMLARYTANGKLDKRFDRDGRLSVSLDPTGLFLDNPSAILPRAGGGVLVAATGERYPGPRTPLLIAVTASGALDSRFGDRR